MKTKNLILILALTSLMAAGCRFRDGFFTDPYYYDDKAPAEPRNVEVINGDGVATVIWDRNFESDVKGYRIYSSSSYSGKYVFIANAYGTQYDDYRVKNGNTYFYAVTAYDYNGNESELSVEYAYAVPRPEGFNKMLNDADAFPKSSGYDFSGYKTVAWNDQETDFFFEKVNGEYYLSVFDDTDIKDMGYTNNILDIMYAPESGWAPKKTAKVYPGHTYVFWLWDNKFAKVRVTKISAGRLVFDWAYQTIEGEPLLKPTKGSGTRTLARAH